MWSKEMEASLRELTEDVLTGMKEWREAHPRATFKEIEEAVDERLSRVRARMLQEAAMASRAAEMKGQRVACPECGAPMVNQGRERRRLTTHHNRPIELERSYFLCPQCGARLSPPG
jgi:uncharacterized protein with PIN domain